MPRAFLPRDFPSLAFAFLYGVGALRCLVALIHQAGLMGLPSIVADHALGIRYSTQLAAWGAYYLAAALGIGIRRTRRNSLLLVCACQLAIAGSEISYHSTQSLVWTLLMAAVAGGLCIQLSREAATPAPAARRRNYAVFGFMALAAFLLAAAVQLLFVPSLDAGFRQAGYPAHFAAALAVFQIAMAACIACPRTRILGLSAVIAVVAAECILGARRGSSPAVSGDIFLLVVCVALLATAVKQRRVITITQSN